MIFGDATPLSRDMGFKTRESTNVKKKKRHDRYTGHKKASSYFL